MCFLQRKVAPWCCCRRGLMVGKQVFVSFIGYFFTSAVPLLSGSDSQSCWPNSCHSLLPWKPFCPWCPCRQIFFRCTCMECVQMIYFMITLHGIPLRCCLSWNFAASSFDLFSWLFQCSAHWFHSVGNIILIPLIAWMTANLCYKFTLHSDIDADICLLCFKIWGPHLCNLRCPVSAALVQ